MWAYLFPLYRTAFFEKAFTKPNFCSYEVLYFVMKPYPPLPLRKYLFSFRDLMIFTPHTPFLPLLYTFFLLLSNHSFFSLFLLNFPSFSLLPFSYFPPKWKGRLDILGWGGGGPLFQCIAKLLFSQKADGGNVTTPTSLFWVAPGRRECRRMRGYPDSWRGPAVSSETRSKRPAKEIFH